MSDHTQNTTAKLLNQAYQHTHLTHKSDTLLINEQSRLRESRGELIYKFGFGQSPFPVLPSAVTRLSQTASHKDYLPVQGLPALRTQIARFHSKHDQTSWDAERILVGPGSKLLIFALMSALPNHTEVLIPTPAWVSYAPQARLAGRELTQLTTCYDERWQLCPELLDVHCQRGKTRPRLLILNYPSNPTGLSPSVERQTKLIEVARRHGVIILADEIYGLLHHDGTHRPLALDYPEGTVTTTGLSKWCGAGGWRLGVMHIPRELGDRLFNELIGFASETWSSVTTPVQEAACIAYEDTLELKEYLVHQRTWLSLIGRWCAQSLKEVGVRVHDPDGGFYLFPDFEPHRQRLAERGIYTSATLTERLLSEAKVALLPGSAFGVDPHQLTARLAYVDFHGAELNGVVAPDHIESLDQIHQLRHLQQGILAIQNWLN